jgi:hypothetical protein
MTAVTDLEGFVLQNAREDLLSLVGQNETKR